MLAVPIDVIGTIANDFRNNEDRHPCIFMVSRPGTVNNIYAYYPKNDEWILIRGISQSTGAAAITFMPTQGPRGAIAAGATTTSIPLTTALPATVGVNQLANRGDGRGFKIRIIGNSAGSSGLTEERLVIANTGETTTPTLLLDSPLSFVPANGDAYEFLSGRLFIVDTQFNYYDVLTNSFSANLAVGFVVGSTNNLLDLDESYVPYNRNPGEGFFGILTATASGAASLTGQAVGGDTTVVLNQYRNFQIRIIEDIGTPTAVGQRRNITSHTAGVSPVYTVPAWAVQPSATAKYVIENNGDRMLFWTSSNANTYTYSISGNVWDTNVTFAARPSVLGAGAPYPRQSFSIVPDNALNARHSFIFSFRGGAGVGSITLDLFNISGAPTGLWTAAITYGNSSLVTFGGSTTNFSSQDPATIQGKYMYIFPSSVPTRLYRFDMQNRMLEPYANNRIPAPAFTAYRPSYTVFVDGDTKLSFMICLCQTTTALFTMGVPIIR